MSQLSRYRHRMRGRPDTEHSQALLRTVIVVLLLFDTLWLTAHDAERGVQLWAINGCSVLFSVLLFARILQRPHASPRRRIVGAVHDNVATTLWLYNSGPLGALALFVYPFVTVGNGFRYGPRYLASSGLLGALGIGVLISLAPAWRQHATIGSGVLLSHVVVMVYTGVLLMRLHRTQSELRQLASCDTLTGLPNRRSFLERLSHMVAAPDRRPLACLYLDLDGFKTVNDQCGHEVGDELLNVVSREVSRCIRAADLVARLGGDEFCVILDGPSSGEEARRVADRIIAAIEGIGAVDGQPVSVSTSIGISFAPAGDLGRALRSEELLKAADEAMYAAKRSGKGCHRLVDLAAAAA